jgi:hypothetical protein
MHLSTLRRPRVGTGVGDVLLPVVGYARHILSLQVGRVGETTYENEHMTSENETVGKVKTESRKNAESGERK